MTEEEYRELRIKLSNLGYQNDNCDEEIIPSHPTCRSVCLSKLNDLMIKVIELEEKIKKLEENKLSAYKYITKYITSPKYKAGDIVRFVCGNSIKEGKIFGSHLQGSIGAVGPEWCYCFDEHWELWVFEHHIIEKVEQGLGDAEGKESFTSGII